MFIAEQVVDVTRCRVLKTGRTWPLTTALIIGGCAGPEPPLTKFDKLSEDEFLFGARTDLEYPENDSKAEATRMAWLEKALADRHLCPRGYIIIGKTFVTAEEVALGQTDNIVYHDLCIGWTSLTACSNVPRVLSLGSCLVVCDEIRMLLHEGAGSAQKVQQAFSFQGRLPIFL